MKKLFPEMPDVPQGMANRASRIIEKHMRMHRVERARDLPEEAKIRLYRDLRFLFDGGSQTPLSGADGGGFSVRACLSRFWEKLEDFLSAFDGERADGSTSRLVLAPYGELGRLAALPWLTWQAPREEPS
ncbi:MAG: hypothetical protein ABFD54_01100 [Armatimonadota bacterium]|nr:hypothetical protein [bacterium]